MVLNSILNIPPITRLYLIGCIVCTLLNHLEYFTTLDLIFNTTLILRGQVRMNEYIYICNIIVLISNIDLAIVLLFLLSY